DRHLIEKRIEKQLEEHGQHDLFGPPAPVPLAELAAQSKSNRQGRDEPLSDAEAEEVLEWIKAESTREYTIYKKLLNVDEHGRVVDPGRPGLARELARMVLPANIYTQWYWKVDLHNLLHFLSLRADPHAQYEIRVYAEAMLDVVRRWVPITYDAFLQHRLNAVTLSATAFATVKRMLAGEKVTEASSGLGKREWRELMVALDRQELDPAAARVLPARHADRHPAVSRDRRRRHALMTLLQGHPASFDKLRIRAVLVARRRVLILSLSKDAHRESKSPHGALASMG